MEKIKPEVDYYIQVGFIGVIYSKLDRIEIDALTTVAAADFKDFGVKSKFRPVYKKD